MEDDEIASCREHVERARLFHAEALACDYPPVRYRKLIAAVYFCQAIVESVKTSCEMEFISKPWKEVSEQLLPILPHYDIIYRVRLHDFHRGAVTRQPGIQWRGPSVLTTGTKPGSIAGATFNGGNFELVSKKGNARLKLDRPLCTMDGLVFDDDTGHYLELGGVVERFLSKADEAVTFYSSLLPVWMGGTASGPK